MFQMTSHHIQTNLLN
uniref:Uncharacterized protein n=1 Tax=Arundo donax TaxID=35708 RepID=A0A0A9C2A7_ARUDO